ncbi:MULTISPECIES: hypothetical protein [unclassified Spiroplasma]|uniref:hypothetical protein n=1 Tax=unclassified Spiroplasma TaxID=2637901 RepID=UPI0030D5C6B7
MPVWLTTIFSVVIILGIFAWIGLSIYQKIRQIKANKKKEQEKLDKDFNFVENSWWNKKNHQYDNLKTNFV